MRNTKKLMIGAAVAAMVQIGFSSSMLAATVVWDGGGADDNLNTAANWVGDVLPATTDIVHFTGLTRLTPNASVAAQYNSLFFLAGATSPFTIGGSPITIGTTAAGNYLNNDTVGVTHTINANVNMVGGTINATQGSLVFGGTVNIGNNALTNVAFNANGANSITINGNIAGTATATSNGFINKNGAGTMFVNSANAAWLGRVFINGGALRINNADALGGGGAIETALTSGGTGLGALELTGGFTLNKPVVTRARAAATINEVSLRNISGNNTLASVTTGSGGSNFNYESAADTLTIQQWTTTGQTGARALRVLGAGNGQIVNWAAPTGAADIMQLTKDGTGTWTLRSGMSSGQFGLTTVNGGNLVFDGGLGARQTGSVIINSGGTVTAVSANSSEGELGNGTAATTLTIKAGGTLDASSFTNYSMQVAQTMILGGTVKAGAITTYGDNTVYLGDANTAVIGTGTVIGNLNLSNQFSTPTGGIHFDLANVTTVGGGVNDLLSVQGAVNVDNSSGPISLRLHPTAGLANGTYRLIEFTGGGTLNAADFTLTGFTAGTTRQSVSVATAAGQVNLVVAGSPGNVVWKGNLSSTWDIGVAGTSNWLSGVAADKYYDFDNVTFNESAANKIVDLSTAITPGSITVDATSDYVFQGSGSLNGATGITKSGSGKLTITNTGPNNITGAININGGTLEVGTGGTDGSIGTGAVTNNGTLVFNKSDNVDPGIITGTGSLVKRGGGNLVLNDASTYSGTTTIESGTVLANNAGSFGDATSGTTVLDGASIYFVNPATIYTEAFSISGGGNASIGSLRSGGSALTTLTGALNVSADTSINNDGGSTLLINNANGITGTGTITKFGSGTLQIAGTAHTWSGGVNVGDGALVLGAGADLGAVNGAIVVAGPNGTLAFGSTQASTYSSAISGNGVIAAGNTGAVTTLTGNLSGFTGTLSTSTFGVASTLIVNTPTNATVARIDSPGSGEGYGILRLERSDALAAGPTINIFAQQDGAGKGRLELANNVTINAAAININQRNVAGAVGSPAVLTPAIAGLLTPAVSSAAGVNTLNGPFVLTTGGSFAGLEAAVGATFNVGGTIKPLATAASARQVAFMGAGTGNASAVISDDTQLINVYKLGTGTWTLSGANTYTGVTRVVAGKLVATPDAQAPILTNAGGADILGGKLSLQYTGDGSALASSINATLTAGYGQAVKFSTGQIRSTTLEAVRLLGWANTGSSVDVAYTLAGDTNLDFAVTFDDLLALAQNYNGTGKVWSQGDSNYDAAVNFDDLLVLAQNYGGSIALANDMATDLGGSFAADWAVALSVVPEPASLGLIAGGLMALRRRR